MSNWRYLGLRGVENVEKQMYSGTADRQSIKKQRIWGAGAAESIENKMYSGAADRESIKKKRIWGGGAAESIENKTYSGLLAAKQTCLNPGKSWMGRPAAENCNFE